jgi:hypothetical protein
MAECCRQKNKKNQKTDTKAYASLKQVHIALKFVNKVYGKEDAKKIAFITFALLFTNPL